MYTCERTGVTSLNTVIVWDFLVNEDNLLGSGALVSAIESMPVQPREGFTITGTISSGIVITQLQVNVSSSFDGAMVMCNIVGASNSLNVLVRSE